LEVFPKMFVGSLVYRDRESSEIRVIKM